MMPAGISDLGESGRAMFTDGCIGMALRLKRLETKCLRAWQTLPKTEVAVCEWHQSPEKQMQSLDMHQNLRKLGKAA